MKLLIFSDIHGDRTALENLLRIDADLYFAAGDLVNWGRGLESMGRILARRADQMYVLPGNHESEADVSQICSEFRMHDFHGHTIQVEGYQIAGLGYSSPTPFDTPGEYSETEIAERLAAFAGLNPLILICHCPPRNTALDCVRDGIHAGSTAVGDFIRTYQPDYFFCGHIHEAAGVETKLGRTRCRNVGKKGYLLEI